MLTFPYHEWILTLLTQKEELFIKIYDLGQKGFFLNKKYSLFSLFSQTLLHFMVIQILRFEQNTKSAHYLLHTTQHASCSSFADNRNKREESIK